MQSLRRKLCACLVMIVAVPFVAADIEHVYTNVAVGQSEFDNSVSGNRIDDEGAAYRLLVGYRFGDFPALEVGYIYFNELAGERADLNVSGLTVGTTGYLPLNPSYAIRGRVGLMRWDARFDEGIDAYGSVGLLAQISRDIELTLEYEVYEIEDYEIDAIMFGIQFYNSTNTRTR